MTLFGFHHKNFQIRKNIATKQGANFFLCRSKKLNFDFFDFSSLSSTLIGHARLIRKVAFFRCFKDNGLEAEFVIRAFGLSEELSTRVGFCFWNTELYSGVLIQTKSRNLSRSSCLDTPHPRAQDSQSEAKRWRVKTSGGDS